MKNKLQLPKALVPLFNFQRHELTTRPHKLSAKECRAIFPALTAAQARQEMLRLEAKVVKLHRQRQDAKPWGQDVPAPKTFEETKHVPGVLHWERRRALSVMRSYKSWARLFSEGPVNVMGWRFNGNIGRGVNERTLDRSWTNGAEALDFLASVKREDWGVGLVATVAGYRYEAAHLLCGDTAKLLARIVRGEPVTLREKLAARNVCGSQL